MAGKPSLCDPGGGRLRAWKNSTLGDGGGVVLRPSLRERAEFSFRVCILGGALEVNRLSSDP